MTRDQLLGIVTRLTSRVAPSQRLTWLEGHQMGAEIGAALRVAGATEGEICAWLGDGVNNGLRLPAPWSDAEITGVLTSLAEGVGYRLQVDHAKRRITFQRISVQ